MARPTKEQAIAIRKRNKQIREMDESGYPRDYICEYFNLDKSTVSTIIKVEKEKRDDLSKQN